MDFSNTSAINIVNEVVDAEKAQYLDFDEKVDAFIVSQGVKSALKEVAYENPLATLKGQLVVSVAESYDARQMREGVLKIPNYTQSNPTGGAWGTAYTPTPGYVGEVKEIIVSTNSATARSIGLRIVQGIVGESTKEIFFSACDKSPLKISTPITIGAGGSIQYKSSDAFTGLLYFSAIIVEKPLVV